MQIEWAAIQKVNTPILTDDFMNMMTPSTLTAPELEKKRISLACLNLERGCVFLRTEQYSTTV